MGLGDTLMLTDIFWKSKGQVNVFSSSPYFEEVMKFVPGFMPSSNSVFMLDAPTAVSRFNVGNGHFIQRLRRVFGYPVDVKPKPFLDVKAKRNPNRVILHFEPGKHAEWQKRWVHKRARELYTENKIVIEQFINAHPELEFHDVGKRPNFSHHNVFYHLCPTTKDLIEYIGTAGWFLGIMSGPMHIATALGLKCIVVINFPRPERVLLPTLVPIPQVEAEWFYPQNVHLHQEGSGPTVPELTRESLEDAFAGRVYPYWTDEYLGLIEEKL
jgi:hypothetical protein